MLDENSNMVFEGGEHIRVRIDLVNGGEQELQSVTAALTGTASLLAQFPTTSLAIGRLQPGQSRSIEFVATVPQSVQQQKAEIHVAVSDSGTPYSAADSNPGPVDPADRHQDRRRGSNPSCWSPDFGSPTPT